MVDLLLIPTTERMRIAAVFLCRLTLLSLPLSLLWPAVGSKRIGIRGGHFRQGVFAPSNLELVREGLLLQFECAWMLSQSRRRLLRKRSSRDSGSLTPKLLPQGQTDLAYKQAGQWALRTIWWLTCLSSTRGSRPATPGPD